MKESAVGADAKDRDREYVFMSIDRSEYVSLSDYIKTKEITMKNLPEAGAAAAYGGGAKGRMDDLLGGLEGEGGEDSADESGSEDDGDYESGNSSRSGDSDDSGVSSDEGSGDEGGSADGERESKVRIVLSDCTFGSASIIYDGLLLYGMCAEAEEGQGQKQRREEGEEAAGVLGGCEGLQGRQQQGQGSDRGSCS